MLFRILFTALTLAEGCWAGVHFTSDKWDVEQGKSLVLTWVDAIGVVNIDLVKEMSRGFTRTNEIVKDYVGNNTLEWTPRDDLFPGEYVFFISDKWSADRSPELSFPSLSLQNNIPRDTSNERSDDGLSSSAVAGIGIGSTLGGILILGLVAFLVYRGRQNRNKLEDEEVEGENTAKQKQKQPELSIQGGLQEVE